MNKRTFQVESWELEFQEVQSSGLNRSISIGRSNSSIFLIWFVLFKLDFLFHGHKALKVPASCLTSKQEANRWNCELVACHLKLNT